MKILNWARKIEAISQNGLTFCQVEYDRERYRQLKEIVDEMLASQSGLAIDDCRTFWKNEEGYATPKVDVRGAAFLDEKILLVRERSDGKWTLPGGWADVNDSPSEAVEREIFEESGYQARAIKLAAVFDRTRHAHPPMLYHVYKLLFICELTGGEKATSNETDAVDFFHLTALPELSTPRVTVQQIELLFKHRKEMSLPTNFD